VAAFGGQLGQTLPLNKNENADSTSSCRRLTPSAQAAAVLNIAAPILALIPQFDAHATPLASAPRSVSAACNCQRRRNSAPRARN